MRRGADTLGGAVDMVAAGTKSAGESARIDIRAIRSTAPTDRMVAPLFGAAIPALGGDTGAGDGEVG